MTLATAARVAELEAALNELEDWVNGYALDHVPNSVYHHTGGFDAMMAAAKALGKEGE